MALKSRANCANSSLPRTWARASNLPSPIFRVASLSSKTGWSMRRVKNVETKSPSANAASATEMVIVFMRSAVRRTSPLLRTMAS